MVLCLPVYALKPLVLRRYTVLACREFDEIVFDLLEPYGSGIAAFLKVSFSGYAPTSAHWDVT